MGPKVPVVTTSTILVASSIPFSSFKAITSSAVITTASFLAIFSLIS